MKEMFNVRIYVSSYEGESEVLEGKITFTCDPDQYGNGYTMGIEGLGEPFGYQGYDIRYDKEFDKDEELLYIVKFYMNRYDGKEYEYGRHWKLLGIRVHEAEEI